MAKKEKQSFWIWLIAVRTVIEGGLLIGLAFGLGHLLRHGIANTLERWASAIDVNPADWAVQKLVGMLTGMSPKKIEALQVGSVLYGLLFIVEGTGLLLQKRWAEYVTVVSTAGFLPLEVLQMIHKFSWTDVVVAVVNLLIVIYLIWDLRKNRKKENASELAATR